MKQRLALFLDGTWNTEDDSTNVLHAYNLTLEGEISDGYFQKRYYDRGVGTGIFESITGGGFGLGLDINVREAYNWLVDNFQQGDQIFIFGFSRGAYTARSLMSFIATCGLIERGAPITINQLWEGYAFISSTRAKYTKEEWKQLLQKADNQYKFRRITKLKNYKNEPIEAPVNTAEKLLFSWSNYVNIHYMGIFDTVGAMGIQALGIEGIVSKLARRQNQYPKVNLRKCRHALAIDEHRASFKLTPLMRYADDKKSAQKFNKKIQQKWFVGAHSNIGGGYANNLLSNRPLLWILEGAEQRGLAIRLLEDLKETPSVESIRDSYSEFAGIIWPHILREKRNYRKIDRDDEVRAGYTLQAINETVDEQAIEWAEQENLDYCPPNLLEYLRRRHPDKAQFAKRIATQEWLGKGVMGRALLLLWSALVALGIQTIASIFWGAFPDWSWMVLAALAAWYVFSDWGEYRTSLKYVFHPGNAVSKTFNNLFLWFRLFGIIAFFIGSIGFVVQAWQWGSSSSFHWQLVLDWLEDWYLIVLTSTIILLPLDMLERLWRKHSLFGAHKDVMLGALGALLGISLLSVLLIFSSSRIAGFSSDYQLVAESEQVAGLFLLTLVLFVFMYYVFQWISAPMRKANLSLDLFKIQKVLNFQQLNKLFNENAQSFYKESKTDDEINQITPRDKKQLSALTQTALWRDILGFVPIYTIIFLVILWIGTSFPQVNQYLKYVIPNFILPGFMSWWWILPIVTFVADTSENLLHLRLLDHYVADKESMLILRLGNLFTLIKFVLFFIVLLLSIYILACLFWEVLARPTGNWRWLFATFSPIVFLVYRRIVA